MNAIIKKKESLTIVSSGAALGADVTGLDMREELSAEEIECVRDAWVKHLVLRFRDQEGLGVEDLIRFSRSFGGLDRRPVRGTLYGGAQNDLPLEINVISNIMVDGKPIGSLGSGEAEWHADMTYNERPPKGSMLYAVEIPPAGGGTSFANMYLAYESLPADLKSRANELKCVHDASRNSTGELRQGFEAHTDPRKTVGAIHPLVITHPDSHQKCLLLGRRRNAYLVGLPVEESEELLDRLWEHAVQARHSWTQEWKIGDAVLWDNRCTMHRRNAFDPESRRLMYRTQIAG